LNVWQTPFVEELAMKMDILRAANYSYDFDHELYFNRDAKKAFSFPFLDDHAEDEVLRSINESTDTSAWKFYFNFPPSERVKREIESTLPVGDELVGSLPHDRAKSANEIRPVFALPI
jgi:hypothetical protein